jgi:hypothetical protein
MLGTIEPRNILLADKAHDSDLREEMEGRCAWANVLATPNMVKTFLQCPGLTSTQRRRVLLHSRAIANRYDKRDDDFHASVQLGSIRIWLRKSESVT